MGNITAKKTQLEFNISETLNCSLDEFKSLYAGYVISTYNSEMPASLRELYQNIATELYQQGFLQGIDMITLHKEVSEMAHNRTKLATATAKMINNINKK